MVWFEKDTYCDMFMSYRFTWEHSYVPYMSVKCDMHLIKSVFFNKLFNNINMFSKDYEL